MRARCRLIHVLYVFYLTHPCHAVDIYVFPSVCLHLESGRSPSLTRRDTRAVFKKLRIRSSRLEALGHDQSNKQICKQSWRSALMRPCSCSCEPSRRRGADQAGALPRDAPQTRVAHRRRPGRRRRPQEAGSRQQRRRQSQRSTATASRDTAKGRREGQTRRAHQSQRGKPKSSRGRAKQEIQNRAHEGTRRGSVQTPPPHHAVTLPASRPESTVQQTARWGTRHGRR